MIPKYICINKSSLPFLCITRLFIIRTTVFIIIIYTPFREIVRYGSISGNFNIFITAPSVQEPPIYLYLNEAEV